MTINSRLDRLARAADQLRRSVLNDGLATSASMRRAAYLGDVPDPVLAGYVAAVRDHAHRISDADIAALQKHGHSDDAIFELTVAAALGAAQQRLDAGLAILDLEPGS
jgi:alkylhydroperoxidase family enzyme